MRISGSRRARRILGCTDAARPRLFKMARSSRPQFGWRSKNGVNVESEGKPKNEAHALFKLLRHGHTVEQLRAEIGCSTDYRRKVLLHFDALLFRRLPAERKAKFEAKITALLAQGWSHRAVRAMLPVTASFIRTVSRQSGACTRHP